MIEFFSKYSLLFVVICLNNVNSNLQDDCINERCCKLREGSTENVLCNSMTLQKCVENDDYCYWNCDKEEDDLSFFGARGHGKFVGFNDGKGEIHDYKKNDNDKEEEDEESESDSLKKKTAKEYADHTSYKVFGKCGDVYEYKLPVSVAQSRLNKIIHGKKNKDISNDYYTNKKLDIEELNEETLDEDIDEEEKKRRLTIFTPDGRTQSTIKNTYPYRTFGLLRSNSGFCSATLISRRVILTAGHCVYDTVNNNWISNLRFYPDATSSADIVASNEYSAEYLMTFNGWIDVTCCTGSTCCGSAWNYDMALVRLSITNTNKGWLSIGYDSSLTASQFFNTYGYPGDKAWGTKWTQFCEYNGVNTETFTSNICDIKGGQSGSAVYAYWPASGTRIIYGTISAESSSVNTYCRMTSAKFDTICDFIDSGETSIC